MSKPDEKEVEIIQIEYKGIRCWIKWIIIRSMEQCQVVECRYNWSVNWVSREIESQKCEELVVEYFIHKNYRSNGLKSSMNLKQNENIKQSQSTLQWNV